MGASTPPKRMVYLAGPISGLTHDEARYGWRRDFRDLMDKYGFDWVHCNSPMRGKEFLADVGVLSSDCSAYPKHAMSTGAGIITRDRNDVRSSDVVVACFLESGGNPSLGTAIEFGWADAYEKPVVMVGPEDDPNVRHLMMARIAGYRVDTLEEAALLVGHLLTPGI